jgi:hypothetical protein
VAHNDDPTGKQGEQVNRGRNIQVIYNILLEEINNGSIGIFI